jgi:antitoxin (DNA-binding transcriptional repressor) of toxin-antitoxin stability system
VSLNQLATSRAHIYTMRYLNQHTAEVIQEINKTREAAAITLHGRFVALIAPLADVDIESSLLYSALDESEYVTQLTGETTASAIHPAESADASPGPGPSAEESKKFPTHSMRFLNQKTAHVVQELNETGRPAAITRRGRFVALMIPLANADVESALLGAVLEQTGTAGSIFGSGGVANINSSQAADDWLPGQEIEDD